MFPDPRFRRETGHVLCRTKLHDPLAAHETSEIGLLLLNIPSKPKAESM